MTLVSRKHLLIQLNIKRGTKFLTHSNQIKFNPSPVDGKKQVAMNRCDITIS